ncbi:MAG: hypothetical protein JWP04_440 [Belnapia sp.]|nr:hypothetical protein [Belnapia sp.]
MALDSESGSRSEPTLPHHALTGWPRHLLLPTALAYRDAMGEGYMDGPAHAKAIHAYLAAGGDRARAGREVTLMIAGVSSQFPDWFWGPTRERIEREEQWWRAQGRWPPPKDPAEWPEHLRRRY